MEKLKSKIMVELKAMGQCEESAKCLIERYFNEALYLKSARKMAFYMTA